MNDICGGCDRYTVKCQCPPLTWSDARGAAILSILVGSMIVLLLFIP